MGGICWLKRIYQSRSQDTSIEPPYRSITENNYTPHHYSINYKPFTFRYQPSNQDLELIPFALSTHSSRPPKPSYPNLHRVPLSSDPDVPPSSNITEFHTTKHISGSPVFLIIHNPNTPILPFILPFPENGRRGDFWMLEEIDGVLRYLNEKKGKA